MKNVQSGSDIFGKQRLALALEVIPILKEREDLWFIENGTLLGAVRSGSFIQADDDFDIAIILNCERRDVPDMLKEMNEYISIHLSPPYQSRIISDYADKIEVYDPREGSYILPDTRYNGADFHHVTVDLQIYLSNKETITSLYHIYKFPPPSHNIIDVLPFKKIEFEGYLFNAPNNTGKFLESVYGSISENAKYNPETGKYEE